jgi:hypothetical protein
MRLVRTVVAGLSLAALPAGFAGQAIGAQGAGADGRLLLGRLRLTN